MPKPISLIKLILLAGGVWVGMLLVYAAGIALAAASLERAQTTTASTIAMMLIAAELLIACGSIAFVSSRARGYARAGVRFIMLVVFALIQLSSSVAVALDSLLVLNR